MEWPDTKGRTAWWVVALVFGAILTWVLISFIGTFVFGLFLYYVTRPAYRRMREYLRPSVAATTALLAFAVPVVLLVGYTLAVATQELGRLQRTVDLGPLAEQLNPYLNISGVVQDPQTLLQNPDAVEAGQLLAQGVLAYIPIVGTSLINLFLALAIAFYLLRDGGRLSRWLAATFNADSGVVDTYTRRVDQDLGSVYFGNILNAFLIAIVAVVVYTILNVLAPGEGIPYPALVGVLAGAASLIPVVGMKLVYVPLGLGLLGRAVVSGEPLWFPVAFLITTVVFIDFIPDLVVRPYVSGRNLHVGLVMIAYIIGPLLFGWYGLFLGPLLLVVTYHFARLLVPVLVDGDEPTPPPTVEPAETATRDDEGADGEPA